MKTLAEAHSKCYHAGIRPGVVYCCETQCVYVDPIVYLDAGKEPRRSMLQSVTFVAAALAAHHALPEGSIIAYVWLMADSGLPGLDGKCHSIAELTKELKRRKQ